VHRWSVSIIVKRDETQSSLFIILQVHSTNVGYQPHPSSGVLTYLLTYSMVQSPSWEANWFAASQEIPSISRNPKVHSRTHKHPSPVSILGQPNPVHIPTSHLPEIRPNIVHPSTSSGVHKTVNTASLQRGQASLVTLEGSSCTKIWPVPEAVVTVFYTPDDGCGWHPQYVEWTCRIINRLLCVVSRWTIININ